MSLYSTAMFYWWFRAGLLLCLPSFGVCVCVWHRDQQGHTEISALGGTQAWSRTAAYKMCHNAVTWDPQLPQNHPSAPAGPLSLRWLPSGWISLLWHFPTQPAAFLPFCPLWWNHGSGGTGFSTGFVFMGSVSRALGTVAEAARPNSVVGSNPTGGQGVPNLLPCRVPSLESLGQGSHAIVLCLGSTPWSQRILVFFGKQLDKQSFLWCLTESVAKRLPLRSGRMVTAVYQLGRQRTDLQINSVSDPFPLRNNVLLHSSITQD